MFRLEKQVSKQTNEHSEPACGARREELDIELDSRWVKIGLILDDESFARSWAMSGEKWCVTGVFDAVLKPV